MVARSDIYFDTAADEECADLWADAVRPLFFVSGLRDQKLRPAKFARGWMLDRLLFLEAEFGAQVLHRTDRHCQAASTGTLVIQTYRYGQNKLEIGDEVIEIGEGEVHVTDYSRGHRSHLQPTHQRSVTVAHELVGYDPSIHPATMRFQTETVIGAILHRTIDTIFQNLDRTTEAEAPVVANGLLALLRNVLFSDVAIAMATPAFAVARTRAIRQFVDEEIAHGRLTVDAVSARFNVSRATLYRDFKEEGGVERFILSRRLEATLSTLAHGPAERGAVTRAAERYGFSSTSHLSREFRRHFGFSPSEVVGSGAPSLLTPDHGARGSAARPGQALEAFLNNL